MVRGMSGKGWGGATVRKARAYWRTIVEAGEAICWRCGRPIVPDPTKRDHGWQVGHLIDRMDGGEHGPENQAPEHSLCNLSAGGKRGGAITAARKAAARAVDRRLLRW